MKSKKLTLLLASSLLTVALAGCSLQDVKAWVKENIVQPARSILEPVLNPGQQEEPKKEDEKKDDQKPSGEDQKPDQGGDHGGQEGGGGEEQEVFYTIQFVNYDDSVLQSGQVKKGVLPVYEGETPAKPGDVQYSYSFDGWDKEIVVASADATYKATFVESVNEYLVKFLDEDGTELQSGKVAYGSMPEFKGATPTKEATAQYEYTFAGWDPELAVVTGEATYTATYNESVRQYTIKFVNADGTELQSESLAYGSMPEYKGEQPQKAEDAQYTYTFNGWDKEIVAVAGDATYTATYSETLKQYKVEFNTNGGNEESFSEMVNYGSTVSKPANPTRDADENYFYFFEGWYAGADEYDFATPITGALTLEAHWDAVSKTEHAHRCEYTHYEQVAPTASSNGVREFWFCSLHNSYVLTQPTQGTITDAGAPYSGEILADDPRVLSYKYDANHVALSEYAYGAGMYCTNVSDYKNSRITYEENGYNCNLYSEGEKYLWRIDLPRIDFNKYPTVTMKVTAPDWYQNNMMGPEADDLSYHTVYGGSKTAGKIVFTLTYNGVHMSFNSLEYDNQLAFENTFTDADIINGLKPAYFYTEDLYDRYLNISNITLSTAATKTSVYSYAADTSKISVVNGTVATPGSVDYSIINNNYATNDTALVIDGNANPGAAVITLPAINFNTYTQSGCVSFKFGVKNNNENMYFGSGSSRIALGSNGPSESNNNNGYVNYEMIITADLAYVHNVYENKNVLVPLTAAMRNGTASIVLSGGDTSIYRRYTVMDFYWNLTPSYEFTMPESPQSVYSYAGDTSKLSVVNGTVATPGSVDYSIISNNYGTNETSLVVSGNANPGAAVVTLPAFNFNANTIIGNVSFKFGVKNNSESMYFGSGDSKVDLGKNSSSSQNDNNNGYINWVMIVTADSAYVHNVYENKNIIVPLTAGMRSGSESIVLSGGGTSIYRTYFFADFYWNLELAYELTAPTSPELIYSFDGDTSKLSVVNGTVATPGSVDYSIINNNYGTNENSLVVSGNANPGAAVITLEAFDFRAYTSVGKVSFKFGVKNNSESMYFGSGDSKVDLGKNSSSSQNDNNNGYVNWELVITASGAYVHNVYEDRDITVTLTDGMRNGSESITISGGGTSAYRLYFVTGFYWQA